MQNNYTTSDFTLSINYMSYKFENGGSYKRFLHNLRTHEKFRQTVLTEGKKIALDNGNAHLYESVGNTTCFLINEYLHEKYSFSNIFLPTVNLINLSSQHLRILKDARKLQMLLPFYKIERYTANISNYLLHEDEFSCLFLTDGLLGMFATHHACELPEFDAVSHIMSENRSNPCIIAVTKSNYLYSPLPPIPPVAESDTSFY